jgi:hypothetical protein
MFVVPILLLLATSAHAQGGGCSAKPTASPEIAGNYVDNYGGLQSVTNDFWYSAGLVFETCSIDNAGHRLVAYNNLRDGYNPGKFSRFEWTKSDNRLWYCQSVFDAATEQAAQSAPSADPGHPAVGGCGNFAWSELIRILP